MGDVARLLVQDGVLGPEDAGRASRAARGGDVASAALELGLAPERALARTLARLHECPGVDLSRSVIPAANLDAVTPAFCREHRVLPVTVGRLEIVLAMADPDDLPAADEVRFVTGRRVLRHAAVARALLAAVDGVERARGESPPVWRGARAAGGADAAGFAAVVRGDEPLGGIAEPVDLPDATEVMELVHVAEMTPFGEYPAPTLQRTPPPAPLPPARAAAPPPMPRAAAAQRPAPAAALGNDEVTASHLVSHATMRIEGMALGKVALVADDDADVRQLVATLLARLGCIVLQAPDGAAALEMVREARPDVVVLDAMMPALHGFEVCRMIKGDRNLRATRVVLCSAVYRGTVGTDAQVAFGADAFVEKPFRLDELTRVVKTALLGTGGAESAEERGAREEATRLWRAASDALAADRTAEAADLARQATGKDPWSAEAHFYLGHALSKLGQLYEAVAAYERSAELRPDVDASHQCLAQAYEKLGFQKSAREAWARAIDTCKDPSRRKAMQARLMKMLGA